MARGYRCFAGLNEALEQLHELYREQALRSVERIDRGIAFTGGARVAVRVPDNFTVRTPKESTVNLKQNELLALIATYSRELNMMIEARSSGAGSFRDEHGPGLKGLVQSHVARIAQLSAELA